MLTLVAGVRVIMLNAWEPKVQRAVETARKGELSLIRKAALVGKKKREKLTRF